MTTNDQRGIVNYKVLRRRRIHTIFRQSTPVKQIQSDSEEEENINNTNIIRKKNSLQSMTCNLFIF